MKEITVNTARPYKVYIDDNILSCKVSDVASALGMRRACIVTDCGVPENIVAEVKDAVKRKGIDVFEYVLPSGERSKSIPCLTEILEFLAHNRFSRKDVLFAVGGGVVGDIAGFAAAIYMRGIRYVQVPTTLLAAVDSSIGGKTAVNISSGKNLVGAFHQPSAVICDISVFNTLPKSELLNGYAEIIKCGLLKGGELWKAVKGLSATETSDLAFLVAECVALKAEIVSQDEREGGLRQNLNLGHTVGHAVERIEEFTLPHGVCVAKGLRKILQLSCEKGLDFGLANEVEELLVRLGFDVSLPYNKAQILSFMRSDKKADGDGISMVLLKGIGQPYTEMFTLEELERIL